MYLGGSKYMYVIICWILRSFLFDGNWLVVNFELIVEIGVDCFII